MHAVAPTVSWAVPAAQGEHDVAPAAAVYEPQPHHVHAPVATLPNWPAPHADTHAPAPVKEYVPLAHAVHAVAPACATEPEPHRVHVVEPAGEDVPLGHAKHAVKPAPGVL